MTTRKRRKFTEQFKADAVQLVLVGGKTIAEVTKQFDLTETALREWVRRAQADTGKAQPSWSSSGSASSARKWSATS